METCNILLQDLKLEDPVSPLMGVSKRQPFVSELVVSDVGRRLGGGCVDIEHYVAAMRG